MLALEIVSFGFGWWLGLYLIVRDPTKILLRLAGLGLVAYALALAIDVLRATAVDPVLVATFARLLLLLTFLPALLWSGALVQLLPEDTPLRVRLARGWTYGLAPVVVLGLTLNASSCAALVALSQPGYLLMTVLVLVPLIAGLILVIREHHSIRPQRARGLILAAALLLTLSVGLLMFPLSGWLRPWLLLSMGLDLELLGFAIALWDAFNEGESLQRDIIRSFAAACGVALLFGALVILTMGAGIGATLPMIALLLATIAIAIALQTFDGVVQILLDRLAFIGQPKLQEERTEARAVAMAQVRAIPMLDLQSLDDDEFVRLTRRALSHYGDLPRLSTSPLTHLPIVAARLAERNAIGNALEAATELKTLLAESIARLKPRSGDFGTSDEWRFYNALHFPYVVGLRPYTTRTSIDGLDSTAREALAWFRADVPERTLHNWQNAAARLVAQDLRGRDGRHETRDAIF